MVARRVLPIFGVVAVAFVPFVCPAFAQSPPSPGPSSSASQSASAAPSPEQRAATLKEQGDFAMDALRYDDALAAYQQAYALSPSPRLLYNIGQVYRARGQYPEALDFLTRFDQEAPPDLKSMVPQLAELLADLRGRVVTLVLHSNVSGARVLVRAVQIGSTPLASVRLNAGPAKIEVLADGYFPFTEQIDLHGGSQTVIDANLVARATSGILVVRSSLGGTSVFVDGRRVGDAPVETIVGAGSHEVVARKEGFDDVDTQAVVKAGERREVSLTLAGKPPITAKWWFWAGVGAVVIAGAAITYAVVTEKSPGTGDGFQPGQLAGPLTRW